MLDPKEMQRAVRANFENIKQVHIRAKVPVVSWDDEEQRIEEIYYHEGGRIVYIDVDQEEII